MGLGVVGGGEGERGRWGLTRDAALTSEFRTPICETLMFLDMRGTHKKGWSMSLHTYRALERCQLEK